jgi:uncharacterized membrane protein SpoIIM required for sporulation
MMLLIAEDVVEFIHKYGGELILERLIPFAVLIIGFFPITVSLVVALEAFVGEKERGTIEPLLSAPLLDWQMYFGKLLASTLPPLLASFTAIGLFYGVLIWKKIPAPDPVLTIQLLIMAAVHALVMVSGAIAVSTQSTSIRAANLLASFIVIPTTLLIQWESSLLFWGNDTVLSFALIGVIVLAGLLVRVGLAHFRREYLLSREIDTFNLRWLGRVFWKGFAGNARSIWDWYRVEIPRGLRQIRMPLVLLSILAVVTLVGSYLYTYAYLPDLGNYANSTQVQEIRDRIPQILNDATSQDAPSMISFPFIFLNNLRATAGVFLLGLISFSVVGILLFMANLGLIGVVLALINMLGLPVWKIVLYGILPHGVFEIPALFLASAAAFRVGAVLFTPSPEHSIGEVLIESIGDWFKIYVGVVIPLLAIAALIETFVTPQLLFGVLRGL